MDNLLEVFGHLGLPATEGLRSTLSDLGVTNVLDLIETADVSEERLERGLEAAVGQDNEQREAVRGLVRAGEEHTAIHC